MITKITLLFLIAIVANSSFGQQLSVITELASTVNETSGLIMINEKLITHNDSGNDPVLYEISTLDGSVTRAVFVQNATNVDWEDITTDDEFIYIGDFGNNNGARTDLRIYILPIADFLNTPNDTVVASFIEFNYADQTDFTPTNFSTNYDAEALVSYNDKLYIFTKNWGDFHTSVYALNTFDANQTIEKIDSFDVSGLITGATFNNHSDELLLTGYTISEPFIVQCKNFTEHNFSLGDIERIALNKIPGYSFQIEAITNTSDGGFLISSEYSFGNVATLYQLENLANVATIDPLPLPLLYPNPFKNELKIKAGGWNSLEIYSATGALTLVTTESLIDTSILEKGGYIVVFKDENQRIIGSQSIIKN